MMETRTASLPLKPRQGRQSLALPRSSRPGLLSFAPAGAARTYITHHWDSTLGNPWPRPANIPCPENGIINPMRTTMDAAGRLVISKKIREEAGLRPGAILDVSCQDGQIAIQPANMRLRFMRRGRLVIALPRKRPRGPFIAETVEATLDAVRQGRAGRV